MAYALIRVEPAASVVRHSPDRLWRREVPPSVGSIASKRDSEPLSTARFGIWSVEFQDAPYAMAVTLKPLASSPWL